MGHLRRRRNHQIDLLREIYQFEGTDNRLQVDETVPQTFTVNSSAESGAVHYDGLITSLHHHERFLKAFSFLERNHDQL